MGSLLDTVELTNLVEGVDRGGQTTMEAEDLVLNYSGERQVVKQLSELLPDVSVTVLSEALIVESVTKRIKIERD